jgi:hypothetical protein
MTLLLDASCALVWLAGQAIAHAETHIDATMRAHARLRRRAYQT